MSNIVRDTLDGNIDEKTFNINNWHIPSHQHDDKKEISRSPLKGSSSPHAYNENQDDDLDNGLIPPIWGPPTWKTLHCISFGYPVNPTKEDKVHYKMFFKMIGYVLPCKSCRHSYIKFIEEGDTKMTDDVFKDRKSLTFWLFKIHQAVNNKIGVSYGTTYEDLVETYESFRAKCSKINNQCMSSTVNIEAEGFRHEYKNECNIIPYKIAKRFKKYGKERGVDDFDNLYKFNDLLKIKGGDFWNKRNNECYAIIKYMRENGISPLEQGGQYKGLPTVEELKLVARLSSNLHFNELRNLLGKIEYSTDKIYKFVV